jgi:hypothetical protein
MKLASLAKPNLQTTPVSSVPVVFQGISQPSVFTLQLSSFRSTTAPHRGMQF